MKTRSRPTHNLHRALVALVLAFLLLASIAAPVMALEPGAPPPEDAAEGAPTLAPNPSSLSFAGRIGDALGRTLTLKAVGGAVNNVRISAGDLLDPASQRAILASQVTVSPSEVTTVDDTATIAVTLAISDALSGVYSGALSIWYDELPDPTTPLTVAMQITLSGVPNVSVDASSANQTLFAETTDLPYIGAASDQPRPLRLPWSDVALQLDRPLRVPLLDITLHQDLPVLGQLPIALIEGSGDSARVTSVEVLPVHNSANGVTLPSGIVRVQQPPSADQPLIIPGHGAGTLDLILRGRNLPAGAYTGSLRIVVDNQAQAVSAAFNVKLKDNWIYAMAVLAASFVIGAAVAWFNARGGAAQANIRKIRKLQRQLDPEHNALENHLQKAELSRASNILVRAMNALRDEREQSVIDARLKEFEDYVKSEVEEIGKTLTALAGLKQEIVDSSKTAEEKISLEAQRGQLLVKVERGALDSRAAAEAEVQAIRDALLPAAQTGFTDGAPAGPARSASQQAFDRYELRIQLGSLAVKGLVYLFALLVGWSALYLTNQTFGASPTDYLTLFLWGATVNVVAGQQIKLEDIYKHKAVQLGAQGQPADPDPGGGNDS
ncbi:MAG: hypothetical protein WA040_14760 [Anaerolineae bacterium]